MAASGCRKLVKTPDAYRGSDTHTPSQDGSSPDYFAERRHSLSETPRRSSNCPLNVSIVALRANVSLSCITICAYGRSGVHLERLLPLCGPQRSCSFALIALELVGHPEQRAKDGGAVISD